MSIRGTIPTGATLLKKNGRTNLYMSKHGQHAWLIYMCILNSFNSTKLTMVEITIFLVARKRKRNITQRCADRHVMYFRLDESYDYSLGSACPATQGFFISALLIGCPENTTSHMTVQILLTEQNGFVILSDVITLSRQRSHIHSDDRQESGHIFQTNIDTIWCAQLESS